MEISTLNLTSAAFGVAYTESCGAATLFNWTEVGPTPCSHALERLVIGGPCHARKFVVSRAGEAYGGRVRGLNRKSRLKPVQASSNEREYYLTTVRDFVLPS
jgi:hypothetical protein